MVSFTKLRVLRLLLWTSAALASACRPEIAGRPSLIDRDVVLAVRSVPAESDPNKPVMYEALYVGPDGDAAASVLDFAMCSARKPLAASGSVALACFVPKGDALMPLGNGATAKGMIPSNVCQVFGPNPPPPMKGQPNGRAADPDTTGGYYQPTRVLARVKGEDDAYAVGVTRLSCGLGGATQEQSADFGARYRQNENPMLESVSLHHGSRDDALTPQIGSTPALVVKRGERITLRARWPHCPLHPKCGDGICGAHETAMTCADDCMLPKGCAGSEPYAYFDAVSRSVVDRRESIRVSWYANDGSFEHDRTGASEAQAAAVYTDNDWTAPDKLGEVLLWVVIRDDRGGVGWQAYKLEVR